MLEICTRFSTCCRQNLPTYLQQKSPTRLYDMLSTTLLSAFGANPSTLGLRVSNTHLQILNFVLEFIHLVC